ncbi:hypothetical protein Nepgr_016337 [Nepenthes gracilis]|uniref:Uncharacterized protein n=1 Tax=Nepenthes gracilis TaxID=150966 RepID=A0AAD3SQB4_NEPGR|nr:hypothetical protein Nepgr_016337 [Nepenthes gracilis]
MPVYNLSHLTKKTSSASSSAEAGAMPGQEALPSKTVESNFDRVLVILGEIRLKCDRRTYADLGGDDERSERRVDYFPGRLSCMPCFSTPSGFSIVHPTPHSGLH